MCPASLLKKTPRPNLWMEGPTVVSPTDFPTGNVDLGGSSRVTSGVNTFVRHFK